MESKEEVLKRCADVSPFWKEYHRECIECEIVGWEMVVGYHNGWKFVTIEGESSEKGTGLFLLSGGKSKSRSRDNNRVSL